MTQVNPEPHSAKPGVLAAHLNPATAQSRIVCRALFAQLSSANGDLGSALLRASKESGASPGEIIAFMRRLAEGLGEAQNPTESGGVVQWSGHRRGAWF